MRMETKKTIARSSIQDIKDQTLAILNAFIIEIDTGGIIQGLSESLLVYLNNKRVDTDLKNISFLDIVAPDDRKTVNEYMDDLKKGITHPDKLRIQLAFPQKEFWIKGNLFSIIENGSLIGFRGIFQDITDSIIREKLIEYMAFHDDLTGLPNRMEIEKKLVSSIEDAQNSNRICGLGFLGLDNFRQINNALGHKIGDRIIFSVSSKLSKMARDKSFIGRWSGDTFAFILTDFEEEYQIRQFAMELIKEGNHPIKFKNSFYYVPYSVGFTIFPKDAASIEMLFNCAETTLNWVKSHGRNHFLFYSDLPVKKISSDQLTIRNKLGDAVNNRKIQVFYQPKIHRQSGVVCGMEALARWYDGELGWVNPQEFITIAESVGLINQIGEQLLENSIKFFASLKNDSLNLAINVSLPQLYNLNFIENITNEARKNNVKPSNITLEITESVAMLEASQAISLMKELKERGFEISIDDFGTGYSSLSRLYQLPIDELKIDISFVKRIQTPDGLRIVKAISQIAQAAHLRTVAEGVEDEAAINVLSKLGIDVFQGYFFSAPIPPEKFIEYIKNFKKK